MANKKVLWVSNSPITPTGYGRQTGLAAATLPDLGIDLAISVNYGLQGKTIEANNGVKLYPSERGGRAQDGGVAWAARAFEPDVIVTFYDPWAMEWMNNDELKDIPWVSWFPVDSKPASAESAKKLVKSDLVMACSQFGVDVLRDYNGIESIYMPCGEDFDKLFVPLVHDLEQKNKMKEAFGFPTDGILFGMVGNNQGVPNRKAFLEALDAFSQLLPEVGGKAYLYLHTVLGQQRGGIDIPAMVEFFGIPDTNIYWVDQTAYHLGQVGTEVLPGLYNSFDVLLQPSYSEGFGIPIIEAQGCGIPVIGANNTTMPELISRAGGWLVKSQNFPHPHGAVYGLPIVSDLVNVMTQAWHEWKNDRLWARGETAREFTAKNYNWKDIAVKMADVLKGV